MKKKNDPNKAVKGLLPLPILPTIGSKVEVPLKGGGIVKTWVREHGVNKNGDAVIRCVGTEWILAGSVKEL